MVSKINVVFTDSTSQSEKFSLKIGYIIFSVSTIFMYKALFFEFHELIHLLFSVMLSAYNQIWSLLSFVEWRE